MTAPHWFPDWPLPRYDLMTSLCLFSRYTSSIFCSLPSLWFCVCCTCYKLLYHSPQGLSSDFPDLQRMKKRKTINIYCLFSSLPALIIIAFLQTIRRYLARPDVMIRECRKSRNRQFIWPIKYCTVLSCYFFTRMQAPWGQKLCLFFLWWSFQCLVNGRHVLIHLRGINAWMTTFPVLTFQVLFWYS